MRNTKLPQHYLRTVNPVMAKKMLNRTEQEGFKNRGMAPATLDRYTNDMRNGNWHSQTAESIKVTDDGVVIDGQHRLHAVINSGKSVKLWVVEGVPKSMFQYIDQGKPRDLKDLMAIEGWAKPVTVAVVGKMLWRRDRDATGNPFGKSIGAAEGVIYSWIQTLDPDIKKMWAEINTEIRAVYVALDRSVHESIIFYLWYVWGKENKDQRRAIFDYFRHNETRAAPASAVAMFLKYSRELNNKRLMGTLKATKGRQQDYRAQIIEAADVMWDALSSRRTIKTLGGFKTAMKAAQKRTTA